MLQAKLEPKAIWTKRNLAVLVAHVIVLSIFLYPTVMELARGDFSKWPYHDMQDAPASLKDGNFWNGELYGDRVLYKATFGPFVIHSLIGS